MAAVFAVAVVDGAATVLDDRSGATATTAEEAAAEFLRATGAVIESPYSSSTTARRNRRRRRRTEKTLRGGIVASTFRVERDETGVTPSELLPAGASTRHAWRNTHPRVEGNDTPSVARRRLDSADGDSYSGTTGSEDGSGDDDGSDEEHDGSECETDDALDPTKVCAATFTTCTYACMYSSVQ